MTTDKKILAAIRELIETNDDEKEWNAVVEKFPELQSAEAIEAMEEIVSAFDVEVMPEEVFQHWRNRVAFLKKRQAPPE
jgi:hypothetical protein